MIDAKSLSCFEASEVFFIKYRFKQRWFNRCILFSGLLPDRQLVGRGTRGGPTNKKETFENGMSQEENYWYLSFEYWFQQGNQSKRFQKYFGKFKRKRYFLFVNITLVLNISDYLLFEIYTFNLELNSFIFDPLSLFQTYLLSQTPPPPFPFFVFPLKIHIAFYNCIIFLFICFVVGWFLKFLSCLNSCTHYG